MSSTLVKPMEKTQLSVKAQTLATIIAIVGAVVVPQIFHVLGAVSGMGTALGATFLPMHLPIILVGLLAGPYAGALAGLLGPVASFAASGMPTAAVLPFMMVELMGYGLSAGLLRNAKMPTFGKVVVAQVAGRVLRMLAVVFAVYVLGNTRMNVASIWTAVTTGIFGIVLQWALLPLITYRVDNMKKNEA